MRLAVAWGRSLRTQILLLMGLTLLVPAVIFTYVTFYSDQAQQAEWAEKQIEIEAILHEASTAVTPRMLAFLNDPKRQSDFLQEWKPVARQALGGGTGRAKIGLVSITSRRLAVASSSPGTSGHGQLSVAVYPSIGPKAQLGPASSLPEIQGGRFPLVPNDSLPPLGGPDPNHRLDRGWITANQKITIAGHLVAQLYAARHWDASYEWIQNARQVTLAVTVVLFILGFAGTQAFLYRLSRDIARIREGLGHLEGDLDYRLPVLRGELGTVVQSINTMADQLQQHVQRQEQVHTGERLAVLGRMIAGIAHEIRNPLAILRTSLQAMRRKVELQQEAQEFLGVMEQQIARQNQVIEELLRYARPPKSTLTVIEPARLLERTANFLGAHLRQNGIQIEVDCPDPLPVIEGDEEKLHAALVNLVINAEQAMEEGGKITLRAIAIKDGVSFQVSDTGPGVRLEDREAIFEPFFSTKSRGTGLGLSVVKQTVLEYGGRVYVTGNLNGATFVVELPMCKPVAEQRGGSDDPTTSDR